MMSVQKLLLRVPVSFWRFGLIGIGGLFVDMTVLYTVMWGLKLTAVPAKAISFLAAATFTWWMNRRYTFSHSGKALLYEWASFLATNAFGGAVNFTVYATIVTRFFPYVWMPALATTLGSLSSFLFNYLGSRHMVFNRTSGLKSVSEKTETEDEKAMPLPEIAYPLTLLVCLAFGGLALWMGMDANWDLQNYHWYNGWSFINGLSDRDLLVGQLASFYNPLLDALYAWMAERLSARFIGFALGMAHGLNFLALLAIGWRLSTLTIPRHRLAISMATALAGILGAGGLSEVGTVFYDNLLSLCVFASIWLVLAQWERLVGGRGLVYVGWAVAGGLPVGLAFGLKQSMVIYCIGLCVAFLVAEMPWPRRISVGFWFGIGVLLGFAVGGGYWAWHLWKTYGNPLFPYFNQVFLSPWALPMTYRDDQFVPHTLVEKLLFIYRFSFAPLLTGEISFRDFRIMTLVTLAPFAGLVWIGCQKIRPFTRPGPTGWLLAAAMATYAVWVPLFSIYRYLVPLEMLAPSLLFATVGLLPLAEKKRQLMALGLVGGITISTVPGNWHRVPWEERTVQVDGVASISVPTDTLVLLSTHEPLSFLIPAFPKTIRFYRIDSTFTLPNDPEIGFRKIFRAAIRDNHGPIASLHIVTRRHEVVKKLAEYNLELDMSSCHLLTTPISFFSANYAFCFTRKLVSPSA